MSQPLLPASDFPDPTHHSHPTTPPPNASNGPQQTPEFAEDRAAETPPEDELGFGALDDGGPLPRPPLSGVGRMRRLVKKEQAHAAPLTAQQRLLLLDTWQRSGLPARRFRSTRIVGSSAGSRSYTM